MDRDQQARFGWVKLREEHQDTGNMFAAGAVYRATLRKWLSRLKHRYWHCAEDSNWELDGELLGLHDIYLSPPTIQEALNRNHQSHLIPATSMIVRATE